MNQPRIRRCTYCSREFSDASSTQVCQPCKTKSSGKDLESIADEYDTSWKMSRALDWRILEDINDMIGHEEYSDLSKLLGVAERGKVIRDLRESGTDPMAIGWVLLSYHLNPGPSHLFSRESLASLKAAWADAPLESKRIFHQLIEQELDPGRRQPKMSIFIAKVDDGPITIGLSEEPCVALRRLQRDWNPMEIDLIAEMPGEEGTINILRAVLADFRIDRDWYSADAQIVIERLIHD